MKPQNIVAARWYHQDSAIGLTERDRDAFRRLPGGPSLLFDINYCSFTGEGPGEFVVEDWRRVGIRARMRSQDRSIPVNDRAFRGGA